MYKQCIRTGIAACLAQPDLVVVHVHVPEYAHFKFADQWDRILLVNEVYQKHMNIRTIVYSKIQWILSNLVIYGTKADDRD